jgi:hypothetical protein
VAWLVDLELQAIDGTITEEQFTKHLSVGEAKWPDTWEFKSYRETQAARTGHPSEARRLHAEAGTAYLTDPYCGETGAIQTTALFLSFSGLLVKALSSDVVIAYPQETPKAGESTWVPSVWRDAYRCNDYWDEEDWEEWRSAGAEFAY